MAKGAESLYQIKDSSIISYSIYRSNKQTKSKQTNKKLRLQESLWRREWVCLEGRLKVLPAERSWTVLCTAFRLRFSVSKMDRPLHTLQSCGKTGNNKCNLPSLAHSRGLVYSLRMNG